MESMRIIYLTDLFYPYMLGGGERQFYEIARRMAKKHEVVVVTGKLRGRKRKERLEGMEIIRTGFPHPLSRRSFLINILSLPLERLRADIIHANQGAFALTLPLHHGKKFLTIHDLYFGKWFSFYRPWTAITGRIMESLVEKIPARLIAVSNRTAEKLETVGRVADIVPNGIELSKFRKGRKEKMILYIGRLVRYKRVDELITAFKISGLWKDGYRLVIVGKGPERKRLMKIAKGFDITFEGYVSEERKIELLSRAEIFANPSEVEGFGIAALEALASGCKVVVKPLECYEFCKINCIKTRNFETGLIRAREMKAGNVNLEKYDWENIVKLIEKLYLK